jgi:nitroreductase|tara:strand:- start:830 stop:1546 length:717 start_codon:yes stop_codon:yes gene_type:complete
MNENTVSKALDYRRSVRIYDENKKIDPQIVAKCIKQASLSPSSDNLQLWEFYHITSKDKLKEISGCCFNQPAAKTSLQIVIPVLRNDLWKKRADSNVSFLKNNSKKNNTKNSKPWVYFEKDIPKVYNDNIKFYGFIKYLYVSIKGLFKPIHRQVTHVDKRIRGHKSVALAAQTFMISMSGYGYDTCPMEGFDSKMIKKVLELPKESEISMVIGCGIRAKNGIYGPRFRVPFNEIYIKK